MSKGFASNKLFVYFRDFVRILLIALIFSTISIFWHINQQRDYYQQYITHATEVRVLTQEIGKYTGQTALGNHQEVFQNLKQSYTQIMDELAVLKNGKSGLPPSPDKIRFEEVIRLIEHWEKSKVKINTILDSQDVILSLNTVSERLVGSLKKAHAGYWDIIKLLENGSGENKKLIKLAYQVDSIGEIINDIEKILMISQDTNAIEKQFSTTINKFFENAKAIQAENQDSALSLKFGEIENYIKSVSEDVGSLWKINASIEKVRLAIFDLLNSNPLMSSLAENLENTYVTYPKTDNTVEFAAYMLGLLSFIVLILFIYLFRKETQLHLRMIEEKNTSMQTEVEKLLNELPEIAGGTVAIDAFTQPEGSKENPTIVDSFDYALSTLRKLVSNIGKTAQNVSKAAADAQKITKELAASSGHQAQEIVEVTASVNAMALSIEQVSANAAESAAVALESVNIAGEGGQVVRNTINGMERIQTQIQETSNYMRRLSDSSQEIGEIVSLIDGIADQTNILSLNASIQAAMAGEAGRGFAVVADEVQRLAEKVSYATKEIGSLVRSIQTDTSQVIVAMEQTKSQVLEGVNSAQMAGSTLEKIETVSRRLSDLIQNISVSASTQASASGKISHIMNDVKDIAKQTASGTMTTVDLIGKLMQFVTDLRNSVFELKLPQDPKKVE